MTKKEYCEEMPAIAYNSDFGGTLIHGIEYEINDYIFVSTLNRTKKPEYHKLMVKYSRKGAYVVIYGRRLYLSECLRTDL